MKEIGPSFCHELRAAGLAHLPVAWSADGTITFGTEMTPSEVGAVRNVYAAHDPKALSPIEVPKIVTMCQARLALLRSGTLTAVNKAVAGIPGDAGEAARIEWEYSQEVARDSSLVLSLAKALELDDDQLDALFITAASL